MCSFTRSAECPYRTNTNRMVDPDDDDDDSGFSGILEIYVHHARNIHNICIYDNQDVYAKFSLICNPDETLSTNIIVGGGRNPEFNESMAMKVTQLEAVLKCEMWMLSRARNYLEDQLLGFALVPISQLYGQGKVTRDYCLSSTDLFHSPAGTVKLTLSISTASSLPANPIAGLLASSSISSEVVLLDRKESEVELDPVEYARVEFPDISVVSENNMMVYEYFSKPGLFLHLGGPPQPIHIVDYEMTTITSCEENQPGSLYSPCCSSVQTSGFLSSTTTSMSDDRVPSEISKEKMPPHVSSSMNPLQFSIAEDGSRLSNSCPDTPTSRKGREVRERDASFSSHEEEAKAKPAKFGSQMFHTPLRNIDGDADQVALQQQIVDMYMKSMQQFTESLAKMKLPMDLGSPDTETPGDLVQVQDNSKTDVDSKKKDGSRVFYGSRAFF